MMFEKKLLFVCVLFLIGVCINAQNDDENNRRLRYPNHPPNCCHNNILSRSYYNRSNTVNQNNSTRGNTEETSGSTAITTTRTSTRGTHTVSFNINGGMGIVPSSQRVQGNSGIKLPNGSGFSFGDARFGGWIMYVDNMEKIVSQDSPFTPTGNITLYAKWELDVTDINSATGLANKLVWLQNNVQSGGNYIIELNANERIGPQFLSYPGKNNITITFRGIGTNRTINFATRQYSNSLIIGSGVTVVLDNNVFLQTNHDRPFIGVFGTLIMNNGSTITCNGDLGVEVSGGTFTMNGGTITGCKTGVVVGLIGGGQNSSGTFTMNGGTITRNNGSGVIVALGTFNMINGTISNNIRMGDGAGVNVGTTFGNPGPAVFNMSGGSITGNESKSEILRDGSRVYARGGGVFVGNRNGKFTMTGGTITGNKGDEGSNGVFASSGTFTNRGGTVQSD